MPYKNSISFSNPPLSSENNLLPNKFEVTIIGLSDETESLNIQSIEIPSISTPEIAVSHGLANLQNIGGKINYDPLSITFLVDENLGNYRQIHNWMLMTLDPNNNEPTTRDIVLIINNSHNNTIAEVSFIAATPTSLSSLPFDARTVEATSATVTFTYNYYKFKEDKIEPSK